MGIDISSSNYSLGIGGSELVETLKCQTEGKPMFSRLWELGIISSKEAKLLRNECLKMQYKVITSSGVEFYSELLKLTSESINSGEDIIVHGIYQDNNEFDIRSQKFWAESVLEQEIIITAISPPGMSKPKWEIINFGLTDDFNKVIKYSPIIELGEIVGIKCGIFRKDLDKKSLFYDLRGMIIKLSTYKFLLTLDKSNTIVSIENYEKLIRENF